MSDWNFLKIREEKLAGIIGHLGEKIELHCLLAKKDPLVCTLILNKHEATLIPETRDGGVVVHLKEDEPVKREHLMDAIRRASIKRVRALDRLIELNELLSEFNAGICLAVDTSFLWRSLLEYLRSRLEEKEMKLSLFIPSIVLQELFEHFDELMKGEELGVLKGFPKFRSRLARRILSQILGARASEALTIHFGTGQIPMPTGTRRMKYLPDLEILRQIRDFSEESDELVITVTCDLGMAMIAEGPCCYIKPEEISTIFKEEGQRIVVSRKWVQQILAELIVTFGLLLLKPDSGNPFLVSYSWKGIERSDYARRLMCLGVKKGEELLNWISLRKERGEGILSPESVPWSCLIEGGT